MPILFGHARVQPGSEQDRIRLGSGVVVVLKGRNTRFLVTAGHVARRAQIESRDTRVVCKVGGAEIPFHWAAIDDHLDLATIPLTPEDVEQIEKQG